MSITKETIMYKTMTFAALLCAVSGLAAAEELRYMSFKELAKTPSEAPAVHAAPQKAAPAERPHWPLYTTQSIHAACRHLGNLGLSREDSCAVYCRVPVDPDGFHNISEFSDYFYYECSMTSVKPISETEVEETVCSGKAIVSKLTNEIVASADVGRRGRPDIRKTDGKPACASSRHAPVPEPPTPIPF